MWIEFEEACGLFGCSERNLYRKIEVEGIKTRKGETTGNGKNRVLLDLDSMPIEVRVKYYRTRLSNDQDTGVKLEGVLDLPDDLMELAWIRYQVLIEMAQVPVATKKANHIAAIARREQVTPATLYRWQKYFAESGLSGLVVRRERADSGASRTFDRQALEYLKSRYMELRSKKQAFEDLVKFAARKNLRIGSYRQATRILRDKIDSLSALKTYMRGGELALKNEAAPCILRDYSDLEALEIICGDHHQFDVMVWDEDEGRILRPWVSAWEDLRTRAIVGWNINTQPNSRTIALALRHAILPKSDVNPVFGIPKAVYIDNGKDYKGRYLSGETWKIKRLGKIDFASDTRGVFAELGIAPMYALPFNPGSKLIERWFETMEAQWGSRLSGYVSGSPSTRDGARVQRDIDNKNLLTLNEFKDQFRQYIDKYHATAHRGQGMNNQSPLQAWQSRLDAGFEPMTLRNTAIDILLLDRIERRIDRNGFIIKGVRFYDPQMIHYFRERVSVRFDPDDLRQVWVFHEHKFLFAVNAYTYGSMKDPKNTISERMRQNRKAMKEVRELFLEASGGVEMPSNLKGNSVKIKKTVYDSELEKVNAAPIPESYKTPRNWRILPDEN